MTCAFDSWSMLSTVDTPSVLFVGLIVVVRVWQSVHSRGLTSGTSIEDGLVVLQNQLRDAGAVQHIGDIGLALGAVGLAFVQPHVAWQFKVLSSKTSIIQYGATPGHYVEKFAVAESSGLSRRILLFVHGGGWGSGQPWMYRLIAEGLGKTLGAHLVFNVGYPVYPQGNIDQQSDSIIKALRFVALHSCVGPKDKVILAGHSSGAHISAHALLSLLQDTSLFSADGSRPLVDLFLGLAGVYDIAKHYPHEAMRGVHQLSPMAGAAGGPPFSDAVSPSLVADNLSAKGVGTNNFPPCVLLHGYCDTVVPRSSTEEFSEALTRLLGRERVQSRILQVCLLDDLISRLLSFNQCDHAAIVTDFMFSNARSAVVHSVSELVNRLLL